MAVAKDEDSGAAEMGTAGFVARFEVCYERE